MEPVDGDRTDAPGPRRPKNKSVHWSWDSPPTLRPGSSPSRLTPGFASPNGLQAASRAYVEQQRDARRRRHSFDDTGASDKAYYSEIIVPGLAPSSRDGGDEVPLPYRVRPLSSPTKLKRHPQGAGLRFACDGVPKPPPHIAPLLAPPHNPASPTTRVGSGRPRPRTHVRRPMPSAEHAWLATHLSAFSRKGRTAVQPPMLTNNPAKSYTAHTPRVATISTAKSSQLHRLYANPEAHLVAPVVPLVGGPGGLGYGSRRAQQARRAKA